ncbi:HAMP domain-containing sensor histidine kinase [Sulfurimonas sp. C5]|uniref:sensor histidine kinase n=1 Tax=Sulfurimonas sp. C5 TaxID=3036947 RepID=UPI002455F4F8|nr:HAMP domain-containing sensor histidine kinase [Sulfurimonas sp. C5]MDH4944436.1 HAMP domain-containing sensor histidine kinase [Sulfurimonas sp. C5]
MKKVEFKALSRSFFIFFFSLATLIGALFFFEYKKDVATLDETIFSEMKICSFNLQCPKFQFDFAPLKEEQLYKLHKEKDTLSGYFLIPSSTKHSLKIYLKKSEYEQELQNLEIQLLIQFIPVLIIVILLSFLFAFYTLAPLRDALKLTEEFVKDILHDFNTPLSTLRLNSSMLKSEFGESTKISRIENAVQTILNLQENLRAYLKSHTNQQESFDLKDIIEERVAMISNNFSSINFQTSLSSLQLHTHRDSFIRVIDNLLSNAAKYNKENGEVLITLEHSILSIKDTGQGIKEPNKIFDRFYKEHERGIGIGLHIVKKICDELNIQLSVESKLNEGSTFQLNLQHLLV